MSAKNLTALFLNNLGVYGLNTQVKDSALSEEWLAQADNVLLDSQGRITCRKGIKQVSQTLTDKPVGSIGAYVKANGDREYYCGADDSIYKYNTAQTPVGLTLQSFASTPQTITDSDWEWVTFNDELFGFQSGHKPITYNGTTWYDIDDHGSWVTPVGITTFNPSCALGGFGRMWAGGVGEESATLFYSDTLIGQKWATGAAGSIDLRTVWGGDEIVAIKNFIDKLVIFGRNTIVIYSNPWDPSSTMVLNEVIEGTGLVSRDSISYIGDDIIFLAYDGIKSLVRTVTTEGKLPLKSYSPAVRDELNWFVNAYAIDGDLSKIKGEYYKKDGLYMLFFPLYNFAYCLDFKVQTPQGNPRVSKFTFHAQECPNTALSTIDGDLLLGLGYGTTKDGSVAKYKNYYEVKLEDVTGTYGTEGACGNAGNTWESVNSKCWETTSSEYQYTYKTPWLDFQDATKTKLLKRLFNTVSGGKGASSTICWYRDYNNTKSSCRTLELSPAGTLYYWGAEESLYGAATYAGSLGSREYRTSLDREVKVVQLKVTTDVAGYSSRWINTTVLAKGGKIR